MRKSRYVWAFALFLLLPALAGAFQPKNQKTDLNQKEFFLPELHLSSTQVSLLDIAGQLNNKKAWDRFYAKNGADFSVYFDPRSGIPINIMGHIPIIPGTGLGNRITTASIAQKLKKPVKEVTADVVASLFSKFISENNDVFGIDTTQLGAVRAVKVNDYLWHVSIPQQINGVPVRWSRFVGAINHGNLVIAERRLGERQDRHETGHFPDQAQTLGFAYVGGRTPDDFLWKNPVA